MASEVLLPRRRWWLLLLVGLALSAAFAPTLGWGATAEPQPLACPRDTPVQLSGSAEPGTALLARFAERPVGGTVADRAGDWRLTLTIAERQGIYSVEVVRRDDHRLVAAFTCYVDLPLGATLTPTASLATSQASVPTMPAAGEPLLGTPTLPPPTPTSERTMVATTGVPTMTSTARGLSTATPTASATPSELVEQPSPTRSPLPTTPQPVELVAAQADDPHDPDLFEYIVLQNTSLEAQELAGWQLVHTTTGERYPFAAISLSPGEFIVVWSGAGVDDAGSGIFFWPASAGRWTTGDVAELRDGSGRTISRLGVPAPEEPL